jgi:hypothetical protein
VIGEKRELWFSEKQRKVRLRFEQPIIFGLLEDGTVKEYTEVCDIGEGPTGSWDDYVFVGKSVLTMLLNGEG